MTDAVLHKFLVPVYRRNVRPEILNDRYVLGAYLICDRDNNVLEELGQVYGLEAHLGYTRKAQEFFD